jgi:hydroxymethylbilane synthase
MNKILRIGTRDSQLAVWQALRVQELLKQQGFASELVYMKSDGDIDLVTPLYELGVQGVFTKTLDAALLSNKIDLAVHSMKDVPTQLAKGIVQAAVLPRANYRDLFVVKGEINHAKEIINHPETANLVPFTIATSSIRRKAQWLNRFPHHQIENLRGNVNTRMKKVAESAWDGAIFAAAGLERINLRPETAFELDWMLPAPAQGAIVIVCNEQDHETKQACQLLNDRDTAICTKIERDFLKTLMGGCSTPISALAQIENDSIHFTGNIFSLDGKEKKEIELSQAIDHYQSMGTDSAQTLLKSGADKIVEAIRNAGK